MAPPIGLITGPPDDNARPPPAVVPTTISSAVPTAPGGSRRRRQRRRTERCRSNGSKRKFAEQHGYLLSLGREQFGALGRSGLQRLLTAFRLAEALGRQQT